MVSAWKNAGVVLCDGRHVRAGHGSARPRADDYGDAIDAGIHSARAASTGAAASGYRGSATRGGDDSEPFEAECDGSGAYSEE